ncbi:hypothetical protein GJ20_gp45 [Lactococcus phage P092]|uniref:Uncharacterized protein n=1 Tax=Lactococcus phage P092 TaxID=1476887 RepID=X4Y7U3_9CAUD|nr:hypothetical protein GJ20_gp45 [Lactococcus phage P092]AHV83086.1 hypothetical protein P092_0045 [Lactococcus phage P092]
MQYNVEYRTKDHSLGYVMAITDQTTFKQLINFIGDYEKPLGLLNYNLLNMIAENDVLYIYLSKLTGRYSIVKNLSTLPELEGEQK